MDFAEFMRKLDAGKRRQEADKALRALRDRLNQQADSVASHVASRHGMTLTPQAEADRADWISYYGVHGNCCCHISPPCASCTHPGNPTVQVEDDSCWMDPSPVINGSSAAVQELWSRAAWDSVIPTRTISREEFARIYQPLTDDRMDSAIYWTNAI